MITLDKCKECGEVRTMINLVGGKTLCVKCYLDYLKEIDPVSYRIASVRRP